MTPETGQPWDLGGKLDTWLAPSRRRERREPEPEPPCRHLWVGWRPAPSSQGERGRFVCALPKGCGEVIEGESWDAMLGQ